jgi:hypothetical protein
MLLGWGMCARIRLVIQIIYESYSASVTSLTSNKNYTYIFLYNELDRTLHFFFFLCQTGTPICYKLKMRGIL